MGTARTACLVEQMAHNTPLGKIIRVNIEDLTLDSGLYGRLWDMNTKDMQSYVSTHSWIFAAILYNFNHDIKLNVSHDTLGPQRIHDKSLMSLGLQYTSKPSVLRSINRVRMKFKVIHLSDITTADGRKLEKRFLNKHPYDSFRNSYNWPTKHRVSVLDYGVWRKFLKYIFPNNNYTLVNPLGGWNPTDDLQYHWDWYVDKDHSFCIIEPGTKMGTSSVKG